MANKTSIYGFNIEYEVDAKGGVYQLRDRLERNESKIFFDAARRSKSCEFEDNEGRNYTLWYRDGGYILTRRG